MRWGNKDQSSSRSAIAGARKWEIMFLWKPMTISGETRWLERACIEYEYQLNVKELIRQSESDEALSCCDEWVPVRGGNDLAPNINPYKPPLSPPPKTMKH